ncbi:MAG: monooxygenase [Acidimicrobiales bacterium]
MAVIVALTIFVASLVVVLTGRAAQSEAAPAPSVTTITLRSPTYRPVSTNGSTDDYHCTLLNPHITRNTYVVSSQFFPGSPEDHHAALFLVPPNLAADARQANVGGHGWTCFGEAGLPNLPINEALSTPFLSVWAPGHGADALPAGTGIDLPAGSLVIMQVHYNMLRGDRPVSNKLVVHTVPATTHLQPLTLDLSFAPPDIPCPSGVSGPLCSRAASIADQARRFGPTAALFVNGIELACGRNPSAPTEGDTTSCTWPITSSGYIVRAQAHMHLLGRSFSLVLDPGTPEARTVLDVPNYNFDYQKAYNLAHPIAVAAGERLEVTCTYDPTLGQELPQLRRAPPHFVTWGDGSSDEMCLALSWIAKALPRA